MTDTPADPRVFIWNIAFCPSCGGLMPGIRPSWAMLAPDFHTQLAIFGLCEACQADARHHDRRIVRQAYQTLRPPLATLEHFPFVWFLQLPADPAVPLTYQALRLNLIAPTSPN